MWSHMNVIPYEWRNDTPNAIGCTSIWMWSHMNVIPYECGPIWMKKWHSKCSSLYVQIWIGGRPTKVSFSWGEFSKYFKRLKESDFSSKMTAYCIFSVISSFIWDHIHMGSHSYRFFEILSSFGAIHPICHRSKSLVCLLGRRQWRREEVWGGYDS